MSDQLGPADKALLEQLETDLWREETRFDPVFMDRVLAADFREIGRSGRTYDRDTTLSMPAEPILSRLPLRDFQCRLLTADVVQITYISEVEYDGQIQKALRSSIWTRRGDSWELRFHQGTPLFVV